MLSGEQEVLKKKNPLQPKLPLLGPLRALVNFRTSAYGGLARFSAPLPEKVPLARWLARQKSAAKDSSRQRFSLVPSDTMEIKSKYQLSRLTETMKHSSVFYEAHGQMLQMCHMDLIALMSKRPLSLLTLSL